MKKHFIITLSIAALSTNYSFGQIAAGSPLSVVAPLGGNVGIGVTSTPAKLEILGTNVTQLRLSNTTSSFTDIKTDATGNLIFTTPTTGKVGFGITSVGPYNFGFQSNLGSFAITDPVATNRGMQIVPSFNAAQERPAGAWIISNCSTVCEGLALSPNGSGLAGVKLGAYAYTGFGGWRSVWETANVSCGSPNLLLLKSGGNVGIGTSTPDSKLTINGFNLQSTAGTKIQLSNFSSNVGSGNIDQLKIYNQRLPSGGNNWNSSEIKIQRTVDVSNMNFMSFRSTDPTWGLSAIVFGYDNTDHMTISYDGKVSIGAKKITGTNSDAKLSVDGKVVAKSLYITMTDWADYVFANDYKLTSLKDVETYYKTNKHLPEIPSEKEVIENGVNVADMNKLLLKKVEELTLYLVQQQKEIDALETQINK